MAPSWFSRWKVSGSTLVVSGMPSSCMIATARNPAAIQPSAAPAKPATMAMT